MPLRARIAFNTFFEFSTPVPYVGVGANEHLTYIVDAVIASWMPSYNKKIEIWRFYRIFSPDDVCFVSMNWIHEVYAYAVRDDKYSKSTEKNPRILEMFISSCNWSEALISHFVHYTPNDGTTELNLISSFQRGSAGLHMLTIGFSSPQIGLLNWHMFELMPQIQVLFSCLRH